MRKQFLTAAAVMAAMALCASTASATPPDFPHNDTDSGNWAAVTINEQASGGLCGVSPCEFASNTTDWYWRSNPTAPPGYIWAQNCSGSIAGSIYGDGSLEITNATIDGFISPFCGSNDVYGFPLAGQVCTHVPTGETWLRQNLQLDHNQGPPSLAGVTFGEITDSGNSETLEFDMTDSGVRYIPSHQNFLHDAEFEIGNGIIEILPEDSETTPCGWEELSA